MSSPQKTSNASKPPKADGAATPTKPPSPKSSRSKSIKGRSGAPNYSKDDITALLDIVKEVENIRANMKELVATKVDAWSKANTRPPRDHESLKSKYDKLSISKKKTRDRSCPPDVRLAKHIARNMEAKMVAMILDDDGESDDENSYGVTLFVKNKEGEGNDNKLGIKCNKRKVGLAGLVSKKPKTEDLLVEKVDTMTGFIGMIAKSMKFANADAGTSNRKGAVNIALQDVQSLKKEMKKDIEETKTMISGMNSVLF
ncbi:hypothetical protein FGB62_103g07 [Gracilaria domingensis]|nr:hypothetical protein FGB62_103g07 [Gracilaria domingensis]